MVIMTSISWSIFFAKLKNGEIISPDELTAQKAIAVNSDDNLMPSCISCHSMITTKEGEIWHQKTNR